MKWNTLQRQLSSASDLNHDKVAAWQSPTSPITSLLVLKTNFYLT